MGVSPVRPTIVSTVGMPAAATRAAHPDALARASAGRLPQAEKKPVPNGWKYWCLSPFYYWCLSLFFRTP